ncbi:unnamed protein product [Clonostachys byssicola]|uniref:Major facilitator superfamily (MFS) profile domain-containing protein n=1 Tax=Clonostachys byssicola TaxID=160290 RepID=A0A9N9XZ27_9HYPO|nr:unnamed protein product [Clonostachys byssicola]
MKDIRFWFAYQIIAGFGSAPAYSTIITSLLDVSFIHQRGSALGFFALVLISGNFLPPIAAGYIVDNQGWQWCFYYLLIFFGLSCLLLLFTAEETGFARATHKARSAINGIAILQNHDSSTKADRDVTKENTAGSAVIEPVASRAERSAYEDAEKLSYYQKMGLYRENPDIKTGYWRLTFSVFKMALLPAAIWMTILFSIASFVVGVILGTLSSFFAEPPYNFSPSAMGLMFLALLIGAVIGSCWGGPFTDWLLLRLARRNGGLYEPEHRLYAYTIVPFLGAGGILLYGIGADQGLHWTIPCLGLLLVGIYLDASTPIAMGYALDSYSGLEDEILQLANVLRNVLGGAFSFGLQPWINHSGRRNTTICIAVMVFTFNITSIGFQLWGKRIRSMMAPTYYKLNDSIHK